jgi:outer membrane scaffolding protein for murein synthesis (MipA/OmpV family)
MTSMRKAQAMIRESDRVKFTAWSCAAVAAIGLFAMSSEAFAVDFTIGAGVGFAPDYQGSEDYEPVPLWNLRAGDLYHPDTYVQIIGTKLNSNFMPHENFRIGLSGQYIMKRSDVDNNQVDNMSNTDDGVLLGVLLGYDFKFDGGSVLGVEFDPRWDIQDDIGGLFTARVKYTRPFGGGDWIFRAGAESTYASGEYMDEYFGVTAGDAARSGLSQYSADSGFMDIGLSTGLTYKFSDSWSTTGTAAYKRLLGDAKDSPVTDDAGSANQFFAGLLVNFSF